MGFFDDIFDLDGDGETESWEIATAFIVMYEIMKADKRKEKERRRSLMSFLDEDEEDDDEDDDDGIVF